MVFIHQHASVVRRYRLYHYTARFLVAERVTDRVQTHVTTWSIGTRLRYRLIPIAGTTTISLNLCLKVFRTAIFRCSRQSRRHSYCSL